MKKLIKSILPYGLIKLFQKFDAANLVFNKQFKQYSAKLSDNRFECIWEDRYPCLNDATSSTSFDSHYVYHTAWATRVLAKSKPQKHIDISSSLYFVSQASAIVPVDFYDYRPASLNLSGLNCLKGDVTALPFKDNFVNSISCMHVVEHIGLGRYGDPIDPQGDIKAISELSRVVASGGQLLFVVPIGGRACIQFNAHRIYTYEMIVAAFPSFNLKTFALITDSGDFIDSATQQKSDEQKYGCGCFWFEKK